MGLGQISVHFGPPLPGVWMDTLLPALPPGLPHIKGGQVIYIYECFEEEHRLFQGWQALIPPGSRQDGKGRQFHEEYLGVPDLSKR